MNAKYSLVLGLLGLASAAMGSDLKNSVAARLPDTANQALVILYANASPAIMPAPLTVREDNAPVGDLPNRTYLVLAVGPGVHTFTVSRHAASAQTIAVEKGQTYILEAIKSDSPTIFPVLRSASVAEMTSALPQLLNAAQPRRGHLGV